MIALVAGLSRFNSSGLRLQYHSGSFCSRWTSLSPQCTQRSRVWRRQVAELTARLLQYFRYPRVQCSWLEPITMEEPLPKDLFGEVQPLDAHEK